MAIAGLSGAAVLLFYKFVLPFDGVLKLSEENGNREFAKPAPPSFPLFEDRWLQSPCGDPTAMTEAMLKLSNAVNTPVCDRVPAR